MKREEANKSTIVQNCPEGTLFTVNLGLFPQWIVELISKIQNIDLKGPLLELYEEVSKLKYSECPDYQTLIDL